MGFSLPPEGKENFQYAQIGMSASGVELGSVPKLIYISSKIHEYDCEDGHI